VAGELCLSPSQINLAFKRLVTAGLITPYHSPQKPQPIIQACIEFLIHGLKYMFPAKLGETARGIRTSYAAPSFKGEISLGQYDILTLIDAIRSGRAREKQIAIQKLSGILNQQHDDSHDHH